ncbi:tape measure protein [Acinetobacter baumannii]|uniref:tape measure protein n=1 Tax=Acinetobacter baumannii TaxID=470 RepID=UPI00215ED5A6|nr:tape measure protein [Acinetobacter baumannii]
MAQESRLVIVIDAKNAERNARNLGNELDSIERKGDFATKSMDGLSVATRQLAGYMAGLVTVSAAISKMDTYTGLQNRLKLVTNNQIELNKATEDTFRIAQKTYSAWDSVLQVYQRFSDNAKTLNLTMDDTARLTETVSKAVAISGASASAADAALVQFGQALASGTLRGEELNSVMEQTPALAKAIAQGMGITVGELRSVAAEGKITSQELVRALKNVQSNVDELFAKTDITIGQSLTLLGNEITKFVGEAGKSSGAAQVLSGSIKTLAGNLDVLTSAMMVGGAYWLGTYIPAMYASGVAVAAKTKELAAQTIAQYTAIQADRAAAAQEVINTQAVVANTQATLASLAAEKALEVQRLKSQITEKGRTATLTRMAELKKIEAQVTRELALAEGALAAAQSRSAAASAATVGIGSRLLGVLGGPVGIGITVASLAAGYLLMRDNSDKANKKLEEQAAVAKKAKDELLALKGLEKDSAINDMTSSFERQNQALAESSSKINIQLNAIAQLYKGNKDIVQVVNDARDGTISMNDAVKRFNELRISKDIYNAIKENTAEFEKNAKEAKTTRDSLKLFGIEVELSGRKAQTAVAGIDDNSKALIGNESAAQKATKAQKGYFDSLRTEVLKSNEDLALLNLGYSEETIKKINELQKAKQAVAAPGTTAIVTNEEIEQIVRAQKALDNLKDKKDALNDAERKQTKELTKQAVLLAGNSEQARNMLRVYQSFRNAGLGDKQARVLTAQVGRENDFRNEAMFGSHKDENNGYTNTGFISWQKTRSTKLMQSLQGQGVLDKNGKIQQTQDALDAQAKFLLQEVMTNKSYSKSKAALLNDDLDYRSLEKIVGKNFIGWDYEGKKLGKDKASQHLAKQDSYYNQLSKILGDNPEAASKAIGDLSKFEDEAYKARAKTLEEVKQLQATYDSETVARSKRREEEINKATILGQSNLIPKINERFDAEEKLAQKQFDFEVNGYKWTEEQKLDYTYETNSLRLVAEGKLSEDQRKVALDGLKLQKQQELGLLKLAQEQQLFQIQQNYLHESDAIAKRYELERKKIEEIRDAKIRAGLLNASARAEDNEYEGRRRDAFQNYQAMSASMGGVQEYYNLDKELEDRRKTIDDALKWNNISEEEARQANLAAEKDYLLKRVKLNSYYGEQITGSMVGMLEAAGDKQSAIYKAMFTANKAFAIAQSLVSIQQGIAQASANPFPYNLAAMASVAAETASIVGNIQSVAGIFHGGKDYVPKEATYLLDKGERVVSPRQNQDLTSFLASQREMNQYNAINSNPTNGSATVLEPIVNVYVMEGQTADVTRNDDGSLDVRIRQIAGEVAEKVFLQGIQNPNSRISKAFKQNYNATPRRQ